MPTLEEVHLGLGSGECTFNYDPELLEELADFRHLLFYRHGKLLGTTVILSRTPSKEGITVSGYGLGFWLGIDNDGPIIENREYIAGNNQLDNGGFETLDALDFPLLWSRSESSEWVLDSTNQHAGSRCMTVSGGFDLGDPGLGKDDVLVSTQPRDVPVGALVRTSCWAMRPAVYADTGRRLRQRTVYEGRYDPPDLLEALDFDVDWTNDSETPGDAVSIDSNTLQMGPVTQIQYVPQPGFETGDLTGWVGNTGVDPDSGIDKWIVVGSDAFVTVHGGSWMAGALIATMEADEPYRFLTADLELDVTPGERYLLNGYIVERPNTRGDATIFLAPSVSGTGVTDFVVAGSVKATNYQAGTSPPLAFLWKQQNHEYEVPDGIDRLGVTLYVMFEADDLDFFAGEFEFDDVTLTRIKGNTAKYTAPAVTVTPEKSYKLLASVTGSWPESGPTRNGSLHYSILMQGAGRDDQIVVSSDLDVSQSATRFLLEHTFTPSSGYDTVTVTIVATDLSGGNVLIDKPSLRCEDTSNYIVDKIIGPTGASWTQYTQDSVAPAGTEKVHIELVAEAAFTEDDVWAVDDVEWHRRETVDDPADMVDAFLKDPDTDEYLVNPGTINDLGALRYDRVFHNVTDRTALQTLLRGGLLDAAREFRHGPDNRLHVGTADELFTHRNGDDDPVYVQEDLLLLSMDEVASSVEDRLTRVKLIGQALQRKAPLPDAVITGEATTTIPYAYDWNNNPVSRTRIISEPDVDFADYADARAQEELDRSSDGGQSITLQISEWSAWGDFEVGDWLPVYKPEALLQDTSNPMTYKGKRVYPIEKRCLKRSIDLARGDGFEIKVRRPDGTLYHVPPSLVRWADNTVAKLELGDVRVDFGNDPQRRGAGVAFVKYRAQQAR